MISSLTPSTLKQYNKPLVLWWKFCREKSIDINEASTPQILEFLSTTFKNLNSYGTLNSYRSAISLVISRDIGNDPEIRRFCKGAAVEKPQKPKYNFTWDTSPVLSYLSKLYPNEDISLEELSKKLVTILALITAQRVQTLSKIRLENIKFVGREKAIIFISDRIKTSGRNPIQPTLEIPKFPENQNLCALSTLQNYISRTKQIRGHSDYLILTIKKPHHSAQSQTISRWIKDVLKESGIDTSIFSAHSTRHASTSAAERKGINLDIIRKTAGWTENSNVFARFYNRPIISSTFASSIINSNVT